MARKPGQVAVPAESRSDVSAHIFWNLGTTIMFNIRIVNFDAGSYLHMTPGKDIEKTDMDKKDPYLKS